MDRKIISASICRQCINTDSRDISRQEKFRGTNIDTRRLVIVQILFCSIEACIPSCVKNDERIRRNQSVHLFKCFYDFWKNAKLLITTSIDGYHDTCSHQILERKRFNRRTIWNTMSRCINMRTDSGTHIYFLNTKEIRLSAFVIINRG